MSKTHNTEVEMKPNTPPQGGNDTTQGKELGDALYKHLKEKLATSNSPEERYAHLYEALRMTVRWGVREAEVILTGTYARMDHVAKAILYSAAQVHDLNTLRVHARRPKEFPPKELELYYSWDLQTLCAFMNGVFGIKTPPDIAQIYKDALPIDEPKRARASDVVRGIIEKINEETLAIRTTDSEGKLLRIRLSEKQRYLHSIAEVEDRINALGLREELLSEGDTTYTAEALVLHPDILINTTSITQCYNDTGGHYMWHFLERLKTREESVPILLGKLSDQFLDEALHAAQGQRPTYETSVTNFASGYALPLLSLNIDGHTFHRDAKARLAHINSAVDSILPTQPHYQQGHLITEPAFFCEKLGIQGRMDAMQDDYKLLIEQKSGKCNEFYMQGDTVRPQEQHLMQMELYRQVMVRNFGAKGGEMTAILFYSKYPKGMVSTGSLPRLFEEGMRLRNEIVAYEYMVAKGNLANMLTDFDPNTLCEERKKRSKLWFEWKLPEAERALALFRNASIHAQLYYARWHEYVQREHMYARLGNLERGDYGLSGLWQESLEDKAKEGYALRGLQLIEPNAPAAEERAIYIRFIGNEEELANTNFRPNDIVILYSYDPSKGEGLEAVRPCEGALLRCRLSKIENEVVTIQMIHLEDNPLWMAKEGKMWAIEHDSFDSSFTAQYNGLAEFLRSPLPRQELLLGLRKPKIAPEVVGSKWLSDIPAKDKEFADIALRAKRAKDYFLLIGPPGTGKTSKGLMHILREELESNGDDAVLLVAYTHRAVGEICAQLEKAEQESWGEQLFDYILLSQPSREGIRRERTLVDRARRLGKLQRVKEEILRTRIFVSTCASLPKASQLLAIRRFSLAIVDEASQITDPSLLPFLCAQRVDGEVAIPRFVLIGDHKQLPSISAQGIEAALVKDKKLLELGFESFGESLFERLLRMPDNEAVRYELSYQARMHPIVAELPNRLFYGGNLKALGKKHQKANKHPFAEFNREDALESLLAKRRSLFINIRNDSNELHAKSNAAEAKAVAAISARIARLFECQKEEKSFNPSEDLGIIVPYRNQIAAIRTQLQKMGAPWANELTIDTVERFQGGQRNVIIYSLTVSSPWQLKFLESATVSIDNTLIDRRLNVALTRAKMQCIVVGNARLVSRLPLYEQLVEGYGPVVQWAKVKPAECNETAPSEK